MSSLKDQILILKPLIKLLVLLISCEKDNDCNGVEDKNMEVDFFGTEVFYLKHFNVEKTSGFFDLEMYVECGDSYKRFSLVAEQQKSFTIWVNSVGSTPCLLGKVVDCNYFRGPKCLEELQMLVTDMGFLVSFSLHVDIDVGSSAVANGVLGLVIGVIRTLMVDMAFLVQGMINPKYSGNEMEEDQEADKKDDGISDRAANRSASDGGGLVPYGS
ncbi:hypothetical protein V6N12_038704 [Hibiscus sabdariffa]|uniref:Protein ENHANCED DISEASE RESISTANCE 2 C-terminal domain-containing protein n=1 Tax=Hibiscus sabdariffa TaxID=183260 RepID=A0ABR2CBG5_9ROSI